MHQELIDELLHFSARNGLRFDYDFDEKRKIYYFKFQNQERTWGYCRELTEELLDLFAGPTVYFAYEIINDLKSKVANLC